MFPSGESPPISKASPSPAPYSPSAEPGPLPPTLSFTTKVQGFMFESRTLLGSTATAILMVAAGYSQESTPLTVAGITICLTALGALYKTHSNQEKQDGLTILKKDFEQLKKAYTHDNFGKNYKNFQNNFQIILENATKELSQSLPREMREFTKELTEFAFDQLTDAFYVSKNEYNETMSLLFERIEARLTDISSNLQVIKSNIHQDKAEIRKTFFPHHKGTLDEFSIEFPMGETHNKGKSVCFVTFESNPELKIVYKPRNVEIDALHADSTSGLFHLLNAFAEKELLSTHRILNKEGYGYAEFLSNTDKDNVLSMDEMKNYYKSIGAIQAMAQTFGLRDLHRENLIVHQKKPYLIDLEVAFNVDALKSNQQTELVGAILFYTDSQNNLVHLDVNNDVIPMKEHFEENKAIYEKFVREGFQEMKGIMTAHKEELKKFIQNIPDHLHVRYVPVATRSFRIVLNRNRLVDQSADLLFELENGLKKKEMAEKEKIKTEDTRQDVVHHDVPILHLDLRGNYYYQGKIIGKEQASYQSLIISTLDNVEHLEMESAFHSAFTKKNQ